ncbi:hypothetical protein AWB67_06540 [Caballeronia terrestris]|uniref:Uncharacterized protein n=1 Tax=Caballeronia terrestris TaxID=1226301 RepID=A0A158KT63_9BURK|nr:hypothetical protein AWB67_06540 [Caballeronia terrestris]
MNGLRFAYIVSFATSSNPQGRAVKIMQTYANFTGSGSLPIISIKSICRLDTSVSID